MNETDNSSPPKDGKLLLLISPEDNVSIVTRTLPAGSILVVDGRSVVLKEELGLGHKVAARAIQKGEKIIRSHFPIGSATCDIEAGEHVHLHNLKSDYLPTYNRGESEA